MRTMLFLFFIGLNFGLLSCQSPKPLSKISDDKILLSYQRTPCFGFCPIYSVTLLKNGRIYFSGDRFVPVADTVLLQLPDTELQRIERITRLPDYQNIIIDTPDYQIMDLPGLKFTDQVNQRKFELDIVIPESIDYLTRRIDQFLISHHLLFDSEINPMLREEIIVELKPGVDPMVLVGQYRTYEINYRKAIGQRYHLYEIITTEENIDKAFTDLRKVQGVKEIQINRELELRESKG